MRLIVVIILMGLTNANCRFSQINMLEPNKNFIIELQPSLCNENYFAACNATIYAKRRSHLNTNSIYGRVNVSYPHAFISFPSNIKKKYNCADDRFTSFTIHNEIPIPAEDRTLLIQPGIYRVKENNDTLYIVADIEYNHL